MRKIKRKTRLTSLRTMYRIDSVNLRYNYMTALGAPPLSVTVEGITYLRTGYFPLSSDPARGMVWYRVPLKSRYY